jgi:hypothetical protein
LLEEEGKDVAIISFPAVLVFASTEKVYEVPLLKPLTEIGLDVALPVIEPGDDVAVYKLLSPGFPKYTGTVKETDADAFPPVAEPIVGTEGCLPSEDPVTPGIGIMQSNLLQVPRYWY